MTKKRKNTFEKASRKALCKDQTSRIREICSRRNETSGGSKVNKAARSGIWRPEKITGRIIHSSRKSSTMGHRCGPSGILVVCLDRWGHSLAAVDQLVLGSGTPSPVSSGRVCRGSMARHRMFGDKRRSSSTLR